MNMVSTPRSYVDHIQSGLTKQDIDRELKRACEDLITLCASNASKPLRSFLDQCSTYLSKPGSSDLPSQPFATPEKIKEVHDTFRNSVKGELERWTSDLMRYLQDAETVRVLVPPAQVCCITFGDDGADQ